MDEHSLTSRIAFPANPPSRRSRGARGPAGEPHGSHRPPDNHRPFRWCAKMPIRESRMGEDYAQVIHNGGTGLWAMAIFDENRGLAAISPVSGAIVNKLLKTRS